MDTLFVLASSILVAISGLLLGKYARRHPEYFWRYLLIGCLATTPLAIGGFTWYEEVFAGFYLLANLPIRLIRLNKFHYLIFVLFIVYMIFQSFRGMINYLEFGQIEDSIRKIRWPIFFLILLGLFYKINNSKIRDLIDKDLPFKVTVFGLIFHIIYGIWGVVALLKGGSAAYNQNAMMFCSNVHGYAPSIFLAIWASTAYVRSILHIVLPAVLITLLEMSRHRRMIGWITLFVITNTIFLYDSRSGSLCLLGLMMIYIPKIGFRNIAVMLILSVTIFVSITFIANTGGKTSVADYYDDLKRTVTLEKDDKYNKKLQDIDRKIWMYSAYPAVTANPINFLFGYGFRMSGRIVAPYVHKMFTSYGKEKAYYDEDVATEAITNIAVDSGTTGLAFVLLLFILSGLNIYKQGGGNRFLLITSLAFIATWLFIINIVDSFLLYLALMPSGLLTLMIRSSYERTIKNKNSIPTPNGGI